MGPAIIGLIGSVIGLLTAVIKRKQIIEYRYRVVDESWSDGPKPSQGGLGTRLCCFAVAALLAFVCAVIAANSEKSSNGISPMLWPFAILVAYAAYQFLAFVLLLGVRLVRW